MTASTVNTANTVIPAKAGIQYADSSVRALLETPCLRRQVNTTAGLHFTDWVLDSRLRGNDGQRPVCEVQPSDYVAHCFCGRVRNLSQTKENSALAVQQSDAKKRRFILLAGL